MLKCICKIYKNVQLGMECKEDMSDQWNVNSYSYKARIKRKPFRQFQWTQKSSLTPHSDAARVEWHQPNKCCNCKIVGIQWCSIENAPFLTNILNKCSGFSNVWLMKVMTIVSMVAVNKYLWTCLMLAVNPA